MFEPSLAWPIQQQRDMIENISTQDVALFLDQQVSTSEDSLEEDHLQDHGGYEGCPAIESCQFVTLASNWRDAKPDHDLARQQRDVGAGIHEQHYVGYSYPVAAFRSVTWATGAGGSKCEAS